MRETILKVLATSMNIDERSITDDMKIRDIPDFDSLHFVMLLSELQETHSINIPLDKAITVETIGQLIECAVRL